MHHGAARSKPAALLLDLHLERGVRVGNRVDIVARLQAEQQVGQAKQVGACASLVDIIFGVGIGAGRRPREGRGVDFHRNVDAVRDVGFPGGA